MLSFRAIVAENDPIIRHNLDAALATLGGTVRLVASGWELLSLLADGDPVDVVVADVRMPMPGGVDALVMARTAGVTVPFVLVDIRASYGSPSRAFDILAARRVDRVACTGDIVQKGADGEAVVDLLRSHWVSCVGGNHDANAVRRAREDGDLGGLSRGSIDWLVQLPTELAYEWDGVRVVLAHAAPCGVDAYVWPDDFPKRLKRALRAVEHDVVVLGHTHVPMKVKYLDVWLVNPGSVRGTQTRDSPTCGVLSLPSLELEILSLADGRAIEHATNG